MKSRELERILAEETDCTAREIDERMRSLRASGVPEFEGRGRGRHAPDIGAQHVALMLFQLVSRRAADAGVVGMRARSLLLAGADLRGGSDDDAEATYSRIGRGIALGEPLSDPDRKEVGAAFMNTATLTTMFMRSDSPMEIDRLEVDGEGHHAWLTLREKETGRFPVFYFTDGCKGRGKSGYRLVLTGDLFRRIIDTLGQDGSLIPTVADSIDAQLKLAVEQRAERRALLAESGEASK
ncbi:hypothetical protein MCEMIH16_01359 [Caulobacteraceae bacterium]